MGSQAIIASTFLERNVDFWPAFLISSVFIALGLFLLMLQRRRFGEDPPTGEMRP